ncbi:shikimate 5-dehydrogenase [Legionella gratiana]|uniref:Shikimate dehydrogenase (NADP(+)) n=1 Tax=Legionella gratiana TaxID=45066 RepID=A0A378J363_9GAMM|nr:shikimate dehydrogenase [Legionella gratiana]KTD11558.1 shikimate 5-dehydrogenase [Legionella gratiana]STX41367.1 shikimate 5-dehydrogenase [Legionella gratiana]
MFQRYAVMGNPIAHSLSPVIHQHFAKQVNVSLTYEKIEADDHDFEQQVVDFFNQGGKGLNITLPFKQRAFAMAQQRSSRCERAGAANTLWVKAHQLYADNTDGAGFIRDLSRYLSVQNKRILILGAGGAARGIIHPLLEEHPAALIIANRTSSKAAAFQLDFPQTKCINLHEVEGVFDVVINATSASMAGEFVALPKECMTAKPFCYDLSYKQQGITAFVQYARNFGCEAVDGLGMLVEQAAEAFFLWHGIFPDTKEVLAFLRS